MHRIALALSLVVPVAADNLIRNNVGGRACTRTCQAKDAGTSTAPAGCP
jgi:hypothetical protein